jgi:hypothetical protein
MRSAVDIILSSFLSRLQVEKQERLLHFLPNNERESIKTLLPLAQMPPIESNAYEKMLEKVHWSWFLPTLKSYSLPEQSQFLAVLDETAARALASEIPCKMAKIDISIMGRSYLRQVLLDSLLGPHDRLIPIAYLPPSPLNKILNLSKTQLITLIDFIAMHDLSVEIRQIVETKILKKIYSYLSEKQRRFLKLTAAKHEVSPPPKIGLDRWDGNEDSLRHLLHKKGLSRLGLALSGQDPSLAWYVCHLLDIGRGSALFKLCEREKNGSSVDTAVRQVEELLEHDL